MTKDQILEAATLGAHEGRDHGNHRNRRNCPYVEGDPRKGVWLGARTMAAEKRDWSTPRIVRFTIEGR